jgi:mannosyltransferase
VVAPPDEARRRGALDRTSAPDATDEGDPHPLPWLIGIALLTAALGLIRLGSKSLWHDEAYSFAMARLPFETFWKALVAQEAFTGLYYLVLHAWTTLGTNEAWLRLPSVTFGVLGACALFALNRRLFGTTVALVAAVLLAVNSFAVGYQQEARAYSMAMFSVVLATYVLVLAVDRPSRAGWMGYAVAAAFAVYAHPFAAFVIGAHLVWLVLRRRASASAVVAFGLCGALIAPLAAILFVSRNIERGIPTPSLASVESAFLALTGGGDVRTLGSVLLLLGYGAFGGLAVVRMVRPTWRGSAARVSAPDLASQGLVLAWLTVPVIGSLALSAAHPIFLPRYLIVVLPALVTLAALGIVSLQLRALRTAAMVGLVGLSILSLMSYYRADFKDGENWRAAAADVTARERPGDGIIFLSRFGRRPFEYYLERFDPETDLDPVYPSLPWGSYTPVLADDRFPSAAVETANLASTHQRVWVVLLWGRFGSPHEGGRPVESELDRDYRIAWDRSYGRFLDVVLYVRTSSDRSSDTQVTSGDTT